MNCDRPLYIEERGEMPKELKRKTLDDVEMTYDGEEETSEGAGGQQG